MAWHTQFECLAPQFLHMCIFHKCNLIQNCLILPIRLYISWSKQPLNSSFDYDKATHVLTENSEVITLLKSIFKIKPNLISRIRKTDASKDLFRDGIQNPWSYHIIIFDPRIDKTLISTIKFYERSINESKLVLHR